MLDTNKHNELFGITLPKTGIFYATTSLKSPIGPLSYEIILEKYTKGQLTRGTFVWFKSLKHWVALGDCKGFDRRVFQKQLPTPGSVASNAIQVWRRNEVVTIKLTEVKLYLADHTLRRADPVYSHSKQSWVRADDHEHLIRIFEETAPPFAMSVETGKTEGYIYQIETVQDGRPEFPTDKDEKIEINENSQTTFSANTSANSDNGSAEKVKRNSQESSSANPIILGFIGLLAALYMIFSFFQEHVMTFLNL